MTAETRGGSRSARRRRAKQRAKAHPPEPENNDPLAGIRFRVCECEPTNYSDHAECVKGPTP